MIDETEAFAAVSAMLWTERETLEHVLFKLVQEQLVLSSGATRWLNRADGEVRAALEGLRRGEVIRAAEVEALARALKLPLESTLAELAAVAPEPWNDVLTEHRVALRGLVFEVQAVADQNRRLLHAGGEAIRETLDRLNLSPSTYDSRGETSGLQDRPFLLDEQA